MPSSATRPLSFDEYVKYDATALANLVRKGDVSPTQLLETAIARAEAVNPQLNAIVTPLYEEGRAMAANIPADGAFRGVSFLLKDLEPEWAGTPWKSVLGVRELRFSNRQRSGQTPESRRVGVFR